METHVVAPQRDRHEKDGIEWDAAKLESLGPPKDIQYLVNC